MADTETAAAASGPLAGLRIVEFVGIGPAPFAAMLLADLGAEIVAIDRPEPSPFRPGKVLSRGRSFVVADLKDPTQQDAALILIDTADALIEGFRPGVMERLGLGPDVALTRNPKLVYGRMTGWGQTGPLADSPGHDINYIALSGALAAIGTRETPVPPLNLLGDFGGGALYLVAGLLAAIFAAQRAGQGQVVDCAISDGVASLMAMEAEMRATGLSGARRGDNLLDGGAPFYRTYVCADGEHIAIGALEPRFFARLCKLIGFDDPLIAERDDPTQWPLLSEKFAAIFKTRTREEWRAALEGTDACFAPVLSLAEAARHPHPKARETFVTIDGVVQPAPAPRFSRTPGAIRAIQGGPHTLEEAAAIWRKGMSQAAADRASASRRQSRAAGKAILISFSGLPGTGKSSIARELAAKIGAVWLRIDSIEQAVRESGVVPGSIDDAGYRAAYAIAEDNLRLGRVVVGDSVNGWMLTRNAWRDIGLKAGAEVVEVEVICTDAEEHRRRIENRTVDVPGLRLPDWQAVISRDYHPWDRKRLVVDTASRGIAACVDLILQAV
jgi:alpha-methylacyl-CoA racemase